MKPILNDASHEEKSIFEKKKAMQFLVSLVEFEKTPQEFKALEFWPGNFGNKGEVIVRRDVGYAETGESHQVGGIQSFSYYPYPQCDEGKHWEEQKKWRGEKKERTRHGTSSLELEQTLTDLNRSKNHAKNKNFESP